MKPVSACAPLLLLLVSNAARADLEPFSFGATETISHDSNLNHTADDDRIASWMSSTEFRAALDQAIGRDRLAADASVSYTTYSNVDNHNSTGYHARGQFDWSTVGDLSGSFEADSQRRRYVYGVEGGEQVSSSTSNEETTNHGSAQIELGGLSRWSLFAGLDAMNRSYSADTFSSNEERQWSTNFGTNYSTTPDLSFGVVGNYTHGEYPHYVNQDKMPTSADFTSRSIDLTTRLQASGNSSFNASVGYTTQDSDLQPTLRFVNGSLNWNWTPPSHFSIRLGLARTSSGGATAGGLTSLNDRSLNNTGSLGVTYALTGKISIVGTADYIQRKYTGVQVPVLNENGTVAGLEAVNGTNHIQRLGLRAHYQPTRTTDLSCGASRETLTADAALKQNFTPNYADTVYSCIASIAFN